MFTVFVIEDDESIRDLVLYGLRGSFGTRGFATAQDFWREARTDLPDLILLDVMLPDEDGVSILRRLRATPKTKALPVILLTAKASEYDRVSGLDIGADDYITKPFSMLELISRIHAVLRRSGAQAQPPVLALAQVRLDADSHQVSVDGAEVALTVKEFDLLALLMSHPGRVMTREQILADVWGMGWAQTRTIDAHVRTLRRKLGAGGAIIHTVRGVGYKAVAR